MIDYPAHLAMMGERAKLPREAIARHVRVEMLDKMST